MLLSPSSYKKKNNNNNNKKVDIVTKVIMASDSVWYVTRLKQKASYLHSWIVTQAGDLY